MAPGDVRAYRRTRILLGRPDARIRESYLEAHDEVLAVGEGHRDGETGGYVGSSGPPSARRRHVATDAVRLALPECRALGIDPVLVTCDVDNLSSALTIEANGGVLEDVRGDKRRYWVATSRRGGPQPPDRPTLAR